LEYIIEEEYKASALKKAKNCTMLFHLFQMADWSLFELLQYVLSDEATDPGRLYIISVWF